MRNKYGKCTEFFTFTIRTYTHTNVCEQKQSQIAYIFCTICGDISFFSGSPRWVHAKSLQSCLTLCDPMDVAHQAPLSMRFSRQEYWSRLPCPPLGDLPDPGIEPTSLTSPALVGGSFTTSTTWEAPKLYVYVTTNFWNLSMRMDGVRDVSVRSERREKHSD